VYLVQVPAILFTCLEEKSATAGHLEESFVVRSPEKFVPRANKKYLKCTRTSYPRIKKTLKRSAVY
jgi:hypothetical protein